MTTTPAGQPIPRASAVWAQIGTGSDWQILALDTDPDGDDVRRAAQRWADASGHPVFVHAEPQGHPLSGVIPGDLPYVGAWHPTTHRGRVQVSRDPVTGRWTVSLDGERVGWTNPHGETAAREMARGLADALDTRRGRCDNADCGGSRHGAPTRATTAIPREQWATGDLLRGLPALVPVCHACRAAAEDWADVRAARAESIATSADALS